MTKGNVEENGNFNSEKNTTEGPQITNIETITNRKIGVVRNRTVTEIQSTIQFKKR